MTYISILNLLPKLWRHHRLAVVLAVLSLCIVIFFTLRLTLFAVFWSTQVDPHLTPEPWMTLAFLARSWDMDPQQVAGVLGLEPGSAKGRTLSEVAYSQSRTVEEIIAELVDFREKSGLK